MVYHRTGEQLDTTAILLQDKFLTTLPPTAPFTCLGFREPLVKRHAAQKAYVSRKTKELTHLCRQHLYMPEQATVAIQLQQAAYFRYSAALEPYQWGTAAIGGQTSN